MTGTPKYKPPRSNQEWARNTEKRLNQAEHPASSRMGDWVLSTDPSTGNLIASYVNGGSVVLVEPPEGGLDPDAVTVTGFPHITVARIATQNITISVLTLIIWDTIQRQTSFLFTAPGTDLVVVQPGQYLATINTYGTNTASAQSSIAAAILVNGSAFVLSESFYTDTTTVTMTAGCTGILDLAAGDVISGQVIAQGNTTIGTSARGPNAVTSMSLTRLPIDL